MSIIIRPATRPDCRRILELVRELADYERASLEVTVTLEEFEEAGFGSRPVWKAFLAEVNGKTEGFALFYTRFSTWKGSRMYLEDLYVTEQMRGKGIGKLLFETSIKAAKDLGFNGMNWQVLDWNTPAINFYNKYKGSLEAGWLNASLTKEQIDMLLVSDNEATPQ